MDTARKFKLLVMAHLVLGGIFAAAWGVQSFVLGFAFKDEIHSSLIAKIGVGSSAAYAVLGVLWLIVGLLLRKGASRGLVIGLSVVGLLFVPFGPLLSVPALLYGKHRG